MNRTQNHTQQNSKAFAPLPASVRNLADENTHPGLALDKYARSWTDDGPPGKLSEHVQKPTIDKVVSLSQSPPAGIDFKALLKRRKSLLDRLGAREILCKTAGPLTLHLARASALENAGLCLHPLYGFAYLPGSGLKGMARAYAETVWLPAQSDKTTATATIQAVFGNEPGEPKQNRQRAGAVVFHDAWPTQWPKLAADIVNNHHPKYYHGEDAPGDWENPVPVYFLAVKPGTEFSFALSLRRGVADEQLLEQAREWLLGALCHLGAGAKTAAGYGAFEPVEGPKPELPPQVRATFECTVELVTPAFLAGANQKAEDCDLRPATLRGLLRWWWRTMHAGYLDAPTLRALEAAIWGDTQAGGAVRIAIQPLSPIHPVLFNYKDRFRPKKEFGQANDLQRPPDLKTTQGLFYLSYGMDEITHGERKQRYYLEPGAQWRITLTARDSRYPVDPDRSEGQSIDAQTVLDQAKAALWLLCHFGGVGSKARKGFGSLSVPQELSAMTCRQCLALAKELRDACGIPDRPQQTPESASLTTILGPVETSTPWKNYWFALDQLGYSVQAFAQKHKHDESKIALGLPRKIHGPNEKGPIRKKDGTYVQDPRTWKPPLWLGEEHPKRENRKPQEMRDPSPVHLHAHRRPDGKLTIRAVAFPSPFLPDPKKSKAILAELLEHLEKDLQERCKKFASEGQTSPKSPQVGSEPPDLTLQLSAGQTVQAVLLEEKTKKGGWKAKIVGTDLVGNIQNSDAVPSDKKPGDAVELTVASVSSDGRQIQFRWPTTETKKSKRNRNRKRR